MTNYQTPDDLKSVPAFVALAPVEANAFLAFNHAVVADARRNTAS